MSVITKRLASTFIGLILSVPVFANSAVLVPSQHGGLKVGIDALYLRPTNSDLGYAINSSSVPVLGFLPPDSTDHNLNVDPSYDWGFYAQVGYLFPCTGNDLTVGYTYLRSDETDSSVAPPPANGTVGNPAIIALPLGGLFTTDPLFPELFLTAQGKAKFDLNAVDLEGGQRFTSGTYDLRMFAGLRYASIDHSLQTFAQIPFSVVQNPYGDNLVALDGLNNYQIFKSNFRGIGPRIGVDGRYCLCSGFGLDANVSTALLVGNVDSHYCAQNNSIDDDGVVTTTNFKATDGSKTRVVPVLEGKLGVDYTYIMDCRCKSALTFEVGYQVTNYFNAVDHTRVVNTSGTGFVYQNNTSDVAFDGIYLGVKYYA